MRIFFLLFSLFLLSCSRSSLYEGPFLVEQIIDGDTIDIEIGRVRFAGINAPETGECYYAEAKERLGELLFQELVILEQDIENYDKYGRLLRYVYKNTTFINGYLIEEGYAKVYDKYNATTKYYIQLKTLETHAKEQKKGVWSCVNPQEDCLFVASKNSNIYHQPGCKWAKRIKPENLLCFHSLEELEGYEAAKSC